MRRAFVVVLLVVLALVAGPASAQVPTTDASRHTVRVKGGKVGRSLSDRFGDAVSVMDYGCKGDGVVDDSACLAAAFALTGRRVYLPAGTYLYRANLVPACAEIHGEGELATVLKPAGTVTIGLDVGGASYPTRLSGFQVEGTAVPTATGIFFGNASSVAVSVEHVRVRGFGGSGGVGFRVGDVLKSHFYKCTAEQNEIGFYLRSKTATFPTSTAFVACVATDNSANGVRVVNASADVSFLDFDFESSGAEGLLVQPVAPDATSDGVARVWVSASHVEDNNRDGAGYHVVVDGAAAGTVAFAALDHLWISTNGVNSAGVQTTGANASAVIRSPQFHNGATLKVPEVSVENSSRAVVEDWPDAFAYTGSVATATSGLVVKRIGGQTDVGGNLRVVGPYVGPVTGEGVELGFDTSTHTGLLNGYSRTASDYRPLSINGKPLKLNPGSGGAINATLPAYATNALAVAGGLVAGDLYRNGDVVQVVH